VTNPLPSLTYLGIFASAIIEGEVVYVTAVVLAVVGRLNPLGVLVSGALGGSCGDQIYFYLLRSRLAHWLDRFPGIVRSRERVTHHVRRRASLLILFSRFRPGLRVASPVACAYADVGKVQFSTLSLISGFLWAGSIMAVVMYLGPTSMRELGIHAWWAPVIPAVFIIVFFRWLSSAQKPEK
jgi:membrane protein DedA with SNARE-associated domain